MNIPNLVGLKKSGAIVYPDQGIGGTVSQCEDLYFLNIQIVGDEALITYTNPENKPFPKEKEGNLFYNIITEYQNI
jgi:hypothetical protein